MFVRRIRLSNFRSFAILDLELDDFNILVGGNASGKSNFTQIFKFLRDITDHGLSNAISIQGGVEYLRNVAIGSSQNTAVEVVCDVEQRFVKQENPSHRFVGIKATEVTYRFSLSFAEKKRIDIVEDKLKLTCNFVELKFDDDSDGSRLSEAGELGKGEIIVANRQQQIHVDSNVPPTVSPITMSDLFPPLSQESKEMLPPGTLLLETPLFFGAFTRIERLFNSFSIYDFDPRLPKKAVTITGKTEMEEDGSNLAIVLRRILEEDETRQEFLRLLRDLLPFIDHVEVETLADKSLFFSLRESYAQEPDIPASFISDGTINILALIVVLYFEEKPFIVVEEPERNVHPFLISRLVSMFAEVSQRRQLILTTHNAEILRHAELDNILLIARDEKGFSTVSRPSENKAVNIFLQNELGLGELFVQDLLGAPV